MNLLILDDHPLVRRGIIDVLSVNYKNELIWEAGNNQTALDIMKSHSIQIAMVDVNLGKENGFDFIEKAQKQYKNTKYIILTSSSGMVDFKRAKQLQVDGYIVKDSFIDDILYGLRVIIRGEKFYSSSLIEKSMNEGEELGLTKLTVREREVYELVRKGYNNAQIAKNLFISEGTIKKHISSILSKLSLNNRVDVIFYAESRG